MIERDKVLKVSTNTEEMAREFFRINFGIDSPVRFVGRGLENGQYTYEVDAPQFLPPTHTRSSRCEK